MINSDEEKKAIKESLKNTENLQDTLQCLEYVLINRSPFALYIATADRSDCMWIFNPETVYEMVGGEEKYRAVYDIMFPTEEERAVGIAFFILRKVGPLVFVKVDIELIDQVINELYNEV